MAHKANRNPEMFAHFESLLEVRATGKERGRGREGGREGESGLDVWA
jgi:hypothetical protein